MLAYRLQADAYGDLDPDAARFLDRIASDRGPAGAKTLPLPDKARAGKGAIFIREWEGVTHRVMHMADGYACRLAHLLANRVYLGEINHKGQSYPAERPAIVPAEPFDAAAATLAENRNGVRTKRASSSALLLGRLFDDRGNPMTPSVTNKKGVRYRYYVSCVVAQGRGAEAGSLKRISAPAITTWRPEGGDGRLSRGLFRCLTRARDGRSGLTVR